MVSAPGDITVFRGDFLLMFPIFMVSPFEEISVLGDITNSSLVIFYVDVPNIHGISVCGCIKRESLLIATVSGTIWFAFQRRNQRRWFIFLKL